MMATARRRRIEAAHEIRRQRKQNTGKITHFFQDPLARYSEDVSGEEDNDRNLNWSANMHQDSTPSSPSFHSRFHL